MVSHAVWKTWPEGLSRQKPRPKAEVFVVTEARGICFSIIWEVEQNDIDVQLEISYSNTVRYFGKIQWNLYLTTTSIIKFIICDLFSNVF